MSARMGIVQTTSSSTQLSIKSPNGTTNIQDDVCILCSLPNVLRISCSFHFTRIMLKLTLEIGTFLTLILVLIVAFWVTAENGKPGCETGKRGLAR